MSKRENPFKSNQMKNRVSVPSFLVKTYEMIEVN